MSHMIELHRVSKFYTNKDTVSTGFARVDLTLDMGEFVAITGESGSGKSTLLNVISGLDTYEEGEMFVAGEDTSGYRTEDYERYRKTYIGNIFQDFNLVNSYTVWQNVELSMMLCGKSRAECRARIPALIEQVDLKEYTKTKVSRLSGGQKQRVAIARALAKDAPIIVADEPTGNLDSKSAEKVMETLYRISRNKLVIIVTHNYEQAEPYVTRKITMNDGRIIEDKRIRPNTSMPEYQYDGYDSSVADSDDEDIEADEAAEVYDSLYHLAETDPGATAGEELTEDESRELRRYARKGGRAERNAEAGSSSAKQKNGSSGPAPEGRRVKKSRGSGSSNRNISFGSQVRLGIRNTFNIPAKFILLLIVYVFVTAAVLGQYASTKQTLHENDLLGYNQYFTDTSPERLIVTKKNGKAFTNADYKKIEGMDNVNYVVRQDSGIDSGILFDSSNIDISGPMYPISSFKESQLSIGRMPKKANEVVLALDDNSYVYDQIKDMGKGILGKSYNTGPYNSDTSTIGHLTREKLKIVGVAFLDSSKDDHIDTNGNVLIYVTNKIANEVLVRNVANGSIITVDFNGTKADFDTTEVVIATDRVSEGHAYISEDEAYQYYNNGAANNKPLTINVKNHYFTSSAGLTVTGIFKEGTIQSMLGYSKNSYDDYSSIVFVNPKDYDRLFDKGNFQSSVYMKDETLSDDTVKSLEQDGLKVLAVKDTLSGMDDGFSFVIKMFNVIMLAVEFIVLFFISYAVIRLIMRSRNSYYSTLRILGASKRNTDNIMRVELMTMMAISYGAVFAFTRVVSHGLIHNQTVTKAITERLVFLNRIDYIVLLAALLAMSVLIANRYSRKIFSKSAMKAYREEV